MDITAPADRDRTAKTRRGVLWAVNLLLTTLSLLLIYHYSSRDGAQTYQDSMKITDWVHRAFYGGLLESDELVALHQQIRQTAHMALYLLLGAAAGLWVQLGRRHATRLPLMAAAGLACAALGFADEWFKQYIPGRHFHLDDVMLNIVSALAGLFVCCGLALAIRILIVVKRSLRLRGHKTHHKEENP